MNPWYKKRLREIKHVLGWILRPRLSYLRLREIVRARSAGPVKHDIRLDKLPPVNLIPADSESKLDEVLEVYLRNPSKMNIAPRSRTAIRRLVAEGYVYYLIADDSEHIIGAICWQTKRAIMCHLAVDYEYRSKGAGIAATLALENHAARQGYHKSYTQVLKNNRRALSIVLSLGYKIDGEDPESTYYNLSKDFIQSEDTGKN